MDKETVTEAIKLECQLEKDIEALQETHVSPPSAEPTTHSTTRAKEACEAVNKATADLRNVLYSMFLKSDTKSNSGEQS